MPTTPHSQAVTFLDALFNTPSAATRICIWTRETKRSTYITAPSDAASFEGGQDIYVSAGLGPAALTKVTRRPKARECVGIPGVWLDVDVDGGPDDKTNRAPDHDSALQLTRVELEPTLLVNSGYGIQAWWLFDETWLFGMEGERDRAQRITQGWETIHRNHASRQGYGLDSTYDLARLMRLPGTTNAKGGLQAPVIILELDGPRYTLERIAEAALTVAPVGVAEVKVDPDAGFPMGKHDALIENHDFYRKTWNHQRKDREAEGWSLSEYDMALAAIAAGANWTDNEIAALIREHRERQGDPLKGRRSDYLERTIGRARQQLSRHEQVHLQSRAAEDLSDADESGELTSDLAYSKLNQVFGSGSGMIPAVKELVQYSDDADDARYVMVFANGQEVNIGPIGNLRDPRKLELRLAPKLGAIIPGIKDDIWRRMLNGILKFRTLRDDPEMQIMEWIRDYVAERVGSADRDEAAKAGEPFEESGIIFLRADGLARFAKINLKERIKTADLWPLLRAAGFEPVKIHHERMTGEGKTTSNYWSCPRMEIE